MNCCICGPVKNCAQYLEKIFENIEKIGSLFDEYAIIIYYDISKDNTLQILKNYQSKNMLVEYPRFLHLPIRLFRERMDKREAKIILKIIR
jgi:hypothetical protein